ncbi:twin-arginine translocation signal domain-containing protein [Alteromonas mediterranea]|nr:twin-arginine translocation signal domain-containing protein [Alteromonas mediterranea]
MKHSNVNKDIKTGMNSRRQFITRAAAGGVVAALASKTAWAGGSSATGCSVSGNLSGNLSNNHECNATNINGLGPAEWKTILRNSSKRAAEGVSNVAWEDVFDIGRMPFGSNPDASRKIKSFLSDNNRLGGNEALVVAYLNAKSERYPLPAGKTAERYVQELYDDIGVVFTKKQFKKAVEATYS